MKYYIDSPKPLSNSFNPTRLEPGVKTFLLEVNPFDAFAIVHRGCDIINTDTNYPSVLHGVKIYLKANNYNFENEKLPMRMYKLEHILKKHDPNPLELKMGKINRKFVFSYGDYNWSDFPRSVFFGTAVLDGYADKNHPWARSLPKRWKLNKIEIFDKFVECRARTKNKIRPVTLAEQRSIKNAINPN